MTCSCFLLWSYLSALRISVLALLAPHNQAHAPQAEQSCSFLNVAPTVTVYTWRPQACHSSLIQHLNVINSYWTLTYSLGRRLSADIASSRKPCPLQKDWAGYHYCGFSEHPVVLHTTGLITLQRKDLFTYFFNQHVNALVLTIGSGHTYHVY